MDIGEVIDGKYELLSRLGQGGMGEVYLAKHVLLRKRVAIKFLHPEYSSSHEILTRFLLEAQAAAAVGHKGIVEVYDVGWLDNGAPFIVMEHLRGESLDHAISESGQLSVPHAVDIAINILSALIAVHHKGIVHRDLKPENIFICQQEDGTESIKILDFGISKVRFNDASSAVSKSGFYADISTTGIVGTPFYMSPEQIQGLRDIDSRSDLWSLGAILFEAITGERVFAADNLPQVFQRIMVDDIVSPRTLCPELPVEVESIVLRALTRDRDHRYSRAEEMMEDLLSLERDSTFAGARPIIRQLEAHRSTEGVALPPSDTEDEKASSTIRNLAKSSDDGSVDPVGDTLPSGIDEAKTEATAAAADQRDDDDDDDNDDGDDEEEITGYRPFNANFVHDASMQGSDISQPPAMYAGEPEEPPDDSARTVKRENPVPHADGTAARSGATSTYGRDSQRTGKILMTLVIVMLSCTAVITAFIIKLSGLLDDGTDSVEPAENDDRGHGSEVRSSDTERSVAPGASAKAPRSNESRASVESRETSGEPSAPIQNGPSKIPEEESRPAEESSKATGTLFVHTNPWSHVYLGDRDLGESPVLNAKLPAGDHTLTLVAREGDREYRREKRVTISRGQATKVFVELRSGEGESSAFAAPGENGASDPSRRPDDGGSGLAPGVLYVDTVPWSRVSADDRSLGTTPVLGAELRPGVHTITLETDTEDGVRMVFTREVTVTSGRPTKVFFDLQSTRGGRRRSVSRTRPVGGNQPELQDGDASNLAREYQ